MNKLAFAVILSLSMAQAAQALDGAPPPQGGIEGHRPPPPPPNMYKVMDKDEDGVITRKEYDSFHDKSFAEQDTNGDGKLTEDEIKLSRKGKFEERKERRTKNGQG